MGLFLFETKYESGNRTDGVVKFFLYFDLLLVRAVGRRWKLITPAAAFVHILHIHIQ